MHDPAADAGHRQRRLQHQREQQHWEQAQRPAYPVAGHQRVSRSTYTRRCSKWPHPHLLASLPSPQVFSLAYGTVHEEVNSLKRSGARSE